MRPGESRRAVRRPEATSARVRTSSSFGISSGSFCRSPSIVTIRSPRARESPACIAGCWPKLRLKRITRTRGSASCSARSFSKVVSVEPSSTNTASHSRLPSAATRRRCSSSTAPSSFSTVTTTDTLTGGRLDTEDQPPAADVERDREASQELVADEAVVDDPLEHHRRVVLRELGRARWLDRACERRERADVAVPGLVGALDPPHPWVVELDAEAGREALVEDQLAAPHVDLDLELAAARNRQRHQTGDRGPVALDTPVARAAGRSARGERLCRLALHDSPRVVDGERHLVEVGGGEEPADRGEAR